MILEPMQELMSRHKAYALSPRDCLKTTLFQKWQRIVAPPGMRGIHFLALKVYSFLLTLHKSNIRLQSNHYFLAKMNKPFIVFKMHTKKSDERAAEVVVILVG